MLAGSGRQGAPDSECFVHALHCSIGLPAQFDLSTLHRRQPNDQTCDIECCAACRPVHKGGELSITYGMSKDNAILARDYGFVLPGNVQDRIPWQVVQATEQQKAVQAATSGTETCQGLCCAGVVCGNLGCFAANAACVCWWRLCACCCTGRPLGLACGDLAQSLAGPLGWAADALFKALGGRPADAPEPEAENLAAETAEETWAAARAALPKLYAGPLLAAAGFQGDMQNGSVSRLRPAGEA